MTLHEVLDTRYSVREFDPAAELPDDLLDRLLEAALRAPNAGNCQPWHLWVVRHAELRQRLADAAAQPFVAEPPVVVVMCVEPERSGERYGQRGRQLYCYQDAANAATCLLLAAVDAGYGGCWVGAFDEAAVAEALGLAPHLRPVALLPLGKPAGEPMFRAPRRPLEEVVTRL